MTLSEDELSNRLDIQVLEASPQRVVARMPVEGNRQPFGVVHGGAFCALGETVGSIAANLHAPSGCMAVGIELNATHHRSASSGYVTATATALRLGRTLCSHQVEIRDDAGALVSTVRITNLIRREHSAPARETRSRGLPWEGLARSIDLTSLPVTTSPIDASDAAAGSVPLWSDERWELGVWEHSEGVSIDVESDEAAVVIGGSGTVRINDSDVVQLRPGVLLVLHRGDRTVWEVREPLRKLYLVSATTRTEVGAEG